MKNLIVITLVLMLTLTTGCRRSDVGMTGGAVVGGIAGSALTGGSAAGTIVGAVGGGWAGRELSR